MEIIKKLSFLFLFLSLTTFNVTAQNFSHWKKYFPGNNINSITEWHDTIFATGPYAWLKINKHNLQYTRVDNPLSSLCNESGRAYNDRNNQLLFCTNNKLFSYQNGIPSLINSGINTTTLTSDLNNNYWTLSGNKVIKYDFNMDTTSFDLSVMGYSNLNNITAANDIWVSTEYNGLVKYSGGVWSHIYSGNSSLPYNFIKSICMDQNNNLWVVCCTVDQYNIPNTDFQLCKYDGTNWTIYNSGTPGFPIYGILNISSFQNKIYINTTFGLTVFNGSSWINYNSYNSGLTNNSVRCVYANNDSIWIGTADGLTLITPNSDTNFNISNNTLIGIPYRITEDKHGTLWIGTAGSFGNVSKVLNGEWTEIQDVVIPPSLSVNSIVADTNANIWFSDNHLNGGVYFISADTIIHYTAVNSPYTLSFVRDIAVDKYNNKWFVTLNAIYRYDNVSWLEYNNTTNPVLQGVSEITADKNGNIWLSNHQSGLLKFDGTVFTSYDSSFFHTGYPTISRLMTDKNGDIWFNLYNASVNNFIALCKFDGTTLIKYDAAAINMPPSLDHTIGLLTLGDSCIWYATNFGFAKYDWTNWTIFNTANSPICGSPREITIDKNNNKWIVTGSDIMVFNEDSIFNSIDDTKFNIISEDKIYPNPARDYVEAEIMLEKESDIKIGIFEITGKLVYSDRFLSGQQGLNKIRIPTGELTSNVYILSICTNESTKSNKIVVIRE